MAISKFKQIRSDNYELMKVQDHIAAAFIPLQTAVIVNGVVLKNIDLVSGVNNQINHRLGRQPVGYMVIKKNASADIWDSVSPTASLTLVLNTDNNCTVDLYVF